MKTKKGRNLNRATLFPRPRSNRPDNPVQVLVRSPVQSWYFVKMLASLQPLPSRMTSMSRGCMKEAVDRMWPTNLTFSPTSGHVITETGRHLPLQLRPALPTRKDISLLPSVVSLAPKYAVGSLKSTPCSFSTCIFSPLASHFPAAMGRTQTLCNAPDPPKALLQGDLLSSNNENSNLRAAHLTSRYPAVGRGRKNAERQRANVQTVRPSHYWAPVHVHVEHTAQFAAYPFRYSVTHGNRSRVASLDCHNAYRSHMD